ncbi:MAG TPA: TOMM precursor leader peptide-binding protein [Gaiellaceae bacterium]|jgi:bacteriocin biosynthesis cyclodehydratase domain-containing protein
MNADRLDIPARPLLKPWLRRAARDASLTLEYGDSAICLEGKAVSVLVPSVLPLLDGTRTVVELEEGFESALRPAVRRVVAVLAEHGALVEGPPVDEAEPSAAAAALMHAALYDELTPGDALDRVAEADVEVVGAARVAAQVTRLLRQSGTSLARRVPWEEAGRIGAVVVAAPAAAELPALAAWNARALEKAVTWLQVLPFNGLFAAVGPLYIPGETCCHECYQRRRASNVAYPEEFWRLERQPALVPTAPGAEAMLAGLAVTTVLRWIAAGDPSPAGVLLAVELAPSPRISEHVVLRVPRCSACSPARDLPDPLPWHRARVA